MIRLHVFLFKLSSRFGLFKSQIEKFNLSFLQKQIEKTNCVLDERKIHKFYKKYFYLIKKMKNDYKTQIKYYVFFKKNLADSYKNDMCELKDIIYVSCVNKQIYGTQFIRVGNKLMFYPIIGIADKFDNLIDDNKFHEINKRRNKHNLCHLEDHIRVISNKSKCIVSMNIYNPDEKN